MNDGKFERDLYDLHEELLHSIARALDDLAKIEDEIQSLLDRMYRHRDKVKKLSQRLIDEWECRQ